jgi:peroxiredoxin
MRKLFYLFAVITLFAACESKGYQVTGTVEGAADGDIVYLQERGQQSLIIRDSAVIAKGKFTFKGVQDSAIVCYVTYEKGDKQLYMDFFLENGKIALQLAEENDSTTGTVNNDLYQEFRNGMKAIAAKEEDNESEGKTFIIEQIKKNNANPVGAHLLKESYFLLSFAELEPILNDLPAALQADEMIIQLKEIVAKSKTTAVGQKFIDVALKTPDGKDIKLSDYAGKGKIVLIDFWASWCAPCLQDMPEVAELYKQYKNKGFEIVGISLDRDGESWKESIKQLNITWPQMSDLKFWSSEAAKAYAINSIPHTILLDGQGIIIERGLRGESLKEKLAELMPPPVPAAMTNQLSSIK